MLKLCALNPPPATPPIRHRLQLFERLKDKTKMDVKMNRETQRKTFFFSLRTNFVRSANFWFFSNIYFLFHSPGFHFALSLQTVKNLCFHISTHWKQKVQLTFLNQVISTFHWQLGLVGAFFHSNLIRHRLCINMISRRKKKASEAASMFHASR